MKIIVRTTGTVPMKLGVKFRVPTRLEWMDFSFSPLNMGHIYYNESIGEAF